jgi:hypothetical protein
VSHLPRAKQLTDTVIMSLIPIRDGDLILFRDLSEKSGPNESPTGMFCLWQLFVGMHVN